MWSTIKTIYLAGGHEYKTVVALIIVGYFSLIRSQPPPVGTIPFLSLPNNPSPLPLPWDGCVEEAFVLDGREPGASAIFETI